MNLAAIVEDHNLTGRLEQNAPMAPISWLRVGGPADWLYQPSGAEDLAAFLKALPGDIAVFPVGVCSNLIIRDGGLRGVVVKLGRPFNGMEVIGTNRVRAGAAALDAHVARKAADAGIDLSFLRTIPGAIGGAVRMNAGCYGTYTADVFVEAQAVTRDGRIIKLARNDVDFAYRHTGFAPDTIITSATFEGPRAEPAEIHAAMEAALAKRAETQPVKDRSCGSTFRNPAGFSSTGRADDVHDLKAWKLIDEAGMRGATLGGAQMSPMHSNFLINTGDATAADLEGLGETVRKRVFETCGISLEWEIARIGETDRSKAA